MNDHNDTYCSRQNSETDYRTSVNSTPCPIFRRFMKRKKTPGSGRKKGSKNKINRAAQLAKALAEAGMTPLEYMLYVMRDPKVRPERRDEMAKAAAPYLHAKRAPENKE